MSSVPTPQGVGISWECATSGHTVCRTAGCRCMCHYRPPMGREQREIVSTPYEKLPTPAPTEDKNDSVVQSSSTTTTERDLANSPVCPKCGKTAVRPEDKFCRYDGTKLEVPFTHCGNCGAKAPTADVYCAECGAPLTKEIMVVRPRPKRKRKDPSHDHG